MYIKDVGVGSPDNLKSFMLAYLDMDTNPIYTNNAHTSTLNPTTRDSAKGISFTISSANIGRNQELINGLDFGNVLDEEYCIFPFLITYTNSTLGSGTSAPNIQYEEVELTEDAPDNWDIDKYQYYFVIKEDGTDDKRYAQVDTTLTWAALRASLIANNQKLYKNTEICSWFYVGSGEVKVSFILGRGGGTDSSASSDNKRPAYNVFTRNIQASNYFQTKGYPRIGEDPDGESVINSSRYSTFGFKIGSFLPNSANRAFDEARFTSNTTNPNPICDCSLMQFGIVVYNNKRYFGVWSIGYDIKYYWGYPRDNESNPWSLTNLKLDSPVDYTTDMDKYEIAFNGICLDDIDVSIETHDGDIPEDEPPASFVYPIRPIDLVGDRSFGLLAEGNSHGFHVYYMTSTEFHDLSERLWNWGRFVKQAYDLIEKHSLLDIASMWLNGSIQYGIVNQSSMNPTNCIVFARKMPSFIERAASSIKYNVLIGGNYQDNLQSYIMEWEVVEKGVNLLLLFDKPTQSFLDFAPYTEATLYLPYIGQISIDPCVCAGGKIEISYVADIMSGLCSVLVRTEVERLGEHRQVRYGPYTGDCSLMVPIAMADSNSMQRNQAAVKAAVAGAAGLVGAESIGSAPQGELVAGDISRTAATQFIGRTGLNAAGVVMTPRTAGMITNLGNNTGTMCPWDVVLQIRSAAPYMFNETMESLGLKCYKVGKLKEFKGFSLVDWIDFKNFDFSTYAMTETEEEMIVRILKGGVFL